MLLLTKGISSQCALLMVGGSSLSSLDSPATVSGLWERFSNSFRGDENADKVTLDWFALALSMLFATRVVSWSESSQLVRSYVST